MLGLARLAAHAAGQRGQRRGAASDEKQGMQGQRPRPDLATGTREGGARTTGSEVRAAEDLRSRRRQREAGDGCCSLCSTRARERCERRRTGAPRERARGRGGSGARARRRSTGGRQGRGRGAARSGVHGAAAAAGRAGEEGDPGGGLLARSAAPWLPARRGRDERGI